MSQVTDVLVSIDTETILKNYPDISKNPAAPTLIDFKHVYMVTHNNHVISGQAGDELDLKADVGDLIRWRETSVSQSFETAVIFYKFVGHQGNHLISPPSPRRATACIAVPNVSNPSEPSCQKIDNHYWCSETLSSGQVTYQFHFLIVDRDCKIAGCCSWSPLISIHN
ncbi:MULTISPECIES: inclusion body family protein [unclassified Pseudomonas]|uniref:inclusion body family protein n=1 Tax=unclassified Pseudomonas TaxID=196821 RepID=UPI002AC91967|nr:MULTISPECIES: inclusion body family protein [unclassified Pseudomonas]MEB0048200.1 inclusion body family protein [Pseudomonas sp. Dout3]MEB0096623.1 inclusion body family protein [Pseudomonas sp. DC1.2]WPX60256.1 inclusion body family protein [Pseudomonas sp. DC1.2]